MPTVRSQYLQINRYGDRTAKRDRPSIPEQHGPIIHTNDTNQKFESKTVEFGDIVYASISKTITPRQVFQSIKNTIPEVVGECGVDDKVFLELLREELTYFLISGSHKWNFLTVQQTLHLQPGKDQYELPSNCDQIISVWTDQNCLLNHAKRKMEFVYVDAQQQDFVAGVAYYTRINNMIKFVRPGLDVNTTPHRYSGDIHLRYHIVPQMPQTMDEPIKWFPETPYAEQYLKQALIEAIYRRTNQGNYVSGSKEKFFNAVMDWDSNFSPIENKRPGDRKLFDFSGMYYKGRSSVSRLQRKTFYR